MNNNNKHSLRSNIKDHGVKTHYTYSQNSDTTAPRGRELYHLQFSLQAASPETFGYTLVFWVSVEWIIIRVQVAGDLTHFFDILASEGT
jgi:hypothetical protein